MSVSVSRSDKVLLASLIRLAYKARTSAYVSYRLAGSEIRSAVLGELIRRIIAFSFRPLQVHEIIIDAIILRPSP